jgi:ATP-dependent DNA helicase
MWFDLKELQNSGSSDDQIIAQERSHNVLAMLHQVLTPFMLRRLKKDVDLDVPPKREILVYAPLAPRQEKMYVGTLDYSILQLVGIEKVYFQYTSAQTE